jgi:ATP-dependent Clp protease ATP-binding subunit ClpA
MPLTQIVTHDFFSIIMYRYIQGRFLPDKAIDLVDEACSSLRVQLDSLPEEIDQMNREKLRLQARIVVRVFSLSLSTRWQ